MREASLAAAVFSFEKVLPDLAELPLAARRALDHAGLRLSLDAWRSLPLEHRRQLCISGADEVVDTGSVIVALRRAKPAPHPIERVADPDPVTVPVTMARSLRGARQLDARTWTRLRPLDRYALAHAHRRSVARNDPAILDEAFDAIVAFAGTVPAGQSPMRAAEDVAEEAPRGMKPMSGGARAVPLSARASRPDRVEVRSARPEIPAQAVAELEAALGAISSPGSYFQSSRPPPPGDVLDPVAVDPVVLGVVTAAAPSAPPVAPSTPPTLSPSDGRDPPQLSTHLSAAGEVRMVDVAGKDVTARRAVASGSVRMARDTIARLSRNDTPKGEVLATARLAGIMAAKRTHDLIPLCHPLPLTNVAVHLDIDSAGLRVNVTAVAEAVARTGVEMEALTAVSVACLTLYDMLKGIDREMVISEVKLLEKSGGKTGHYRREGP